MSNKYVMLTGSKNNAGDYLIKYRAKELLKQQRSDREIIDLNAWEKFDDDKLKIVNESKCLILMGGPSLQFKMRPLIYSMTNNLDDIKVPIVSMGIGWKSISGNWINTYNYPLNKESLALLDRVNNSGYLSSVRDFHTLNSLRFKGLDNFLMTGCPAYYNADFISKDFEPKEIKKVAFSLGVSFIESISMLKLMKENILTGRDEFSDKEFEVVFHHSLDKEKYLNSAHAMPIRHRRHIEFSEWLQSQKIKYVDISGSAENLIEYYSNIDLHIGYRVHAHIFMNSISKFSILISEDGRAKGVYGVIGGIVLDGYTKFKESLISKAINRYFRAYDIFDANTHLSKEILSNYEYEQKSNYVRLKNSRNQIDTNFQLMLKFLKQLP